MSPESQRVALAELCPKSVLFRDGVPYWRNRYEYTESSCTVSLVEFDPIEDFNAVNIAEGSLFSKDQGLDGEYRDILRVVVERDFFDGKHWSGFSCHATTAQRMESILKALGKWVEAK